METTIYEHLKKELDLKKKEINQLIDNSQRTWDEITLKELSIIADYLNMSVSEII